MSASTSGSFSDEMQEILRTSGLQDLDDAITRLLANQKGQALIKGEDLGKVLNLIRSRVLPDDRRQQLLACAMIGRVAAIATGREDQAFKSIETLFSGEPTPIDDLSDGKAKAYAASMLRHVSAEWVGGYCVRQALEIDSADLARTELLSIALARTGSLTDWFRLIAQQSGSGTREVVGDQLLKRRRRVLGAMADVATAWDGALGEFPGKALGDCVIQLLDEKPREPDVQTLAEAVDSALGILIRLIQLRFSHALYAETYSVVERCRNFLGLGYWTQVSKLSRHLGTVRISLMEAALVLARQNRTDSRLISVISSAYATKAQAISALRGHFGNSADIDQDVRLWWESLGVKAAVETEHKQQVGISEDEQIGQLLLDVDDISEAMEKVGRAIAPFLEISDPVLAVTAKRAVAGYTGIAQVVRRLARMRRLDKEARKGEIIEFNPRNHQMLGERIHGIRKVRVVRDAVLKDFAGRKKILVKSWVEPEE